MSKRLLNFILILIISCIFINCANRGTPQGGEKDIEPPKILSTSPKNYSTNFTGKEIRIKFNEYIKIKNLQKQLIISPPMKTQPEITPQGSASKEIRIKIHDTLEPNTTYAFNFGNSIEDNNEGNPYTYYRYVFSTGDYIDSLAVTGNITDALKRQPDTFVSVMLYEVDSTFHDSIVYKETPKYITNTLDSVTTYTIENVKAGKYLLLALKDNNGDNKFQQKTDKIGFYKDFIDVPTDSSYNIKLFKEVIDYKASRPQLISKQKIMFGYEGNYQGVKINLKSDAPEEFAYRLTKDPKTDTLYYWYKPNLEVDSLVFNINKLNYEKDYTVRIKEKQPDSLIIRGKPSGGSIHFTEDFKISGTIPFTKFDTSKIKLFDKDTTLIDFKINPYDSIHNTYSFSFDKTEDNSYAFEILPEAFTDFFGNVNDTIYYALRTNKKDQYGNVRININNAKYPIIVQLTSDKEEVKYELYATEKKPLDFLDVDPGKYYIRVIFDANKNKIYDTGNFLKRIKPEVVKYSAVQIEVRAGWDLPTDFNL